MKRTFEFTTLELILLIGALARSQSELELLPDRFLKDFKADIDKLLKKLEDDTLMSSFQNKN